MDRVNIKFYFDNEFEIWKEFDQSETEQGPMVLSPPSTTSSTCLQSVQKLQARISLIRGRVKCRRKAVEQKK